MLVIGDTTTTLVGALAAFYAGVPVVHLEAGLRTGDPTNPFPEEMNRLLTTRMASMHLAATPLCRDNLLAEGVPADETSLSQATPLLTRCSGPLSRSGR